MLMISTSLFLNNIYHLRFTIFESVWPENFDPLCHFLRSAGELPGHCRRHGHHVHALWLQADLGQQRLKTFYPASGVDIT